MVRSHRHPCRPEHGADLVALLAEMPLRLTEFHPMDVQNYPPGLTMRG
jgi:hypothetical protein